MQFKIVNKGLNANVKYYFQGPDGKLYGEGYDDARDFKDGYAAVKKGGKWYFVNEDFTLYGEGYDDARDFKDGYAAVKKGSKWYFVDKGFRLYGEGYDEAYDFRGGYGVVQTRGYLYFVNKDFKLCGEGYDTIFYDVFGGYFKVKKYGKCFYVKIEELDKTGSSHLYGYRAFSEGFNVVYENGKYYFIDKNGKLYGEGYDDACNFHEGYAAVKKGGKWYFVDKDFKLCGEGYDDFTDFKDGYAIVQKDGKYYFIDKNFKFCGEMHDNMDYLGKGVVSVVNGERIYYTKLTPDRELKVYGGGFHYKLSQKEYRWVGENETVRNLFCNGKSYRLDGVNIKELCRHPNHRKPYSWEYQYQDSLFYKSMKSKDYLNLAKEDPTYCLCIPEEEFSDKFVKKLGNIASKYYKKKIKNSDSKNYNEIEQEMKFVQETMQAKQEEYRKIQAKEAKIEPQQESLLKAAKAMFVGDGKYVGNEVLKQAPAESQQKVEAPKTTETEVKVAKAEKPVEKKPAEEQSAETEKKQGAEDGAIREVSERLQKYYQILLYNTRKATENEKNAIKNYIDKNKDIIASDKILSKLSGQILPLCDSEQGEENE